MEFHFKAEADVYAAKASSVVIRHVTGHRVIAVVEIVSPGNKSSRSALDDFISKAIEMLKGGIRLLAVDLFPPGPRDPGGIHKAIKPRGRRDRGVLQAAHFGRQSFGKPGPPSAPAGTILGIIGRLAALARRSRRLQAAPAAARMG